MTLTNMRLHQLYILRSQVDLLIAMEEGLPQDALAESEGCQHPEEKRIPKHNFGEAPKFYCQACKETIQGEA